MKKLTLPLCILAAMTLICALSTWQVGRICRETAAILEQAETHMTLGDYEGAETLVLASERLWESHAGFLGTALRHTESDDVDILFPPLLATCRQEDGPEFDQQYLALVATLRQIARMEKPWYYNVL